MGYQKHFLTFLFSLVLTRLISGSEALESLVIASNCTSTCGGIRIPYPFGIEEGCYYKDKDDGSLESSMRITCNHTFSPPQPILGDNVQILNISLEEGEISLNNNVSYNCRKSYNSSTYLYWYSWINLRNFTISSSKNKFVATGCDTYAWFKGKRYGKNYSTGCMTMCSDLTDVVNGSICNGVGCCEASIPDGVTNLKIEANSFYNHIGVEFNPCSVAYPVANDAFYFSTQNLTQNLSSYLNEQPSAPIIYNWGIGTKNCLEAEKEGSRLCKSNTECINLTHEQQGLDGYRCDCKEGYSGNPYLPQGNTDGSYYCKCPKGYDGNGTQTDRCISSSKTWLTPVIITNNQLVAIKRSLKVDPGQVEQFINEVLILSQINNRNVVRLLGCCLETEVPLLVYEYINNGTLYDHLHDEAKVPLFTWNIRLGIASEVAEVLAYLHTTITTPIIHRDMKSMNILLDECYMAKVADFGASRLVPVDQGQLATMVLGTWGYLDPEYMQTSELTEKSDAYSFGVVLVELLTSKKALSYQRPEVERCLAMHFLLKMKEDRLFDIIDKNIANSQGDIEQIKKVANLAKWCLFLKGEDRPTMKEVAMELEGIKRTKKHPWHDVESSYNQENDCESLLRGIPKDDDGNSGGYSGQDSDLYKCPSFISSLGGGR